MSVEPDKKWALVALGCTGALGLLALLGFAGVALVGLGAFIEAPGPTPYSDLGDVPQTGSPIDLPPISPDDEEGTALGAALADAGLDVELHLLVDRGEGKIYVFERHGSDAVKAWENCRSLTSSTGFSPVILGDGAIVESYASFPTTRSPSEILTAADAIDADTWIRERTTGDLGPPPRGDYVSTGTEPSVTVTTDIIHRTPLHHVAIALVPTTTPWEVPAWLAFGGWNDCPMPEVHVALMKRWHEAWGAEPISASHDVIEMRVARPPSTRADAMRVAEEHFAYCYDIVYQGTDSLDALGAEIEGSDLWFFWWD